MTCTKSPDDEKFWHLNKKMSLRKEIGLFEDHLLHVDIAEEEPGENFETPERVPLDLQPKSLNF